MLEKGPKPCLQSASVPHTCKRIKDMSELNIENWKLTISFHYMPTNRQDSFLTDRNIKSWVEKVVKL